MLHAASGGTFHLFLNILAVEGLEMNDRYPFVNIPLPYEYDALEPFIDEKTMRLHHDAHLQSYIDNLNKELEARPALQGLTLKQLIRKMPGGAETPLSRNAGGVYNHRFYFDGLSPFALMRPNGELTKAIDRDFKGFNLFKEELTAAAMSVFGSGYAWLAASGRGRLQIVTTENQMTPLTRGLCPILNIDVWEHAYYLKHYNKRAGYIRDWFKVVNWPEANIRYLSCTNHL